MSVEATGQLRKDQGVGSPQQHGLHVIELRLSHLIFGRRVELRFQLIKSFLFFTSDIKILKHV